MQAISPEEVQKLLKQNEILLVDVREEFEHKAESINGSVLISKDDISHEKIPTNISKKIVFYCRSGKRSYDVCSMLSGNKTSANSDLEFYSMDGGILKWIELGFATQKNSSVISIERQIQILVGFLILSSALLTIMFNENFILISVLIGSGLIFAGIRGVCAMGTMLRKMPWNK